MCHVTPLSSVAIASQRVEVDREANLHGDEGGVYLSHTVSLYLSHLFDTL